MSNHSGHIWGGIVAYGITLAAVLFGWIALGHSAWTMKATKHSLFFYLPAMIEDLHHALTHYLPQCVKTLQYILAAVYPLVLRAAEWFLCALAGAMFPDIDIKSTSQKWLYAVLFVIMLALIGNHRYDLVAFLGILAITPAFSHHRGLFHRVWFVTLLPLGIWWWISITSPALAPSLFINVLFFIAGALSHLWLDMGFGMFRW